MWAARLPVSAAGWRRLGLHGCCGQGAEPPARRAQQAGRPADTEGAWEAKPAIQMRRRSYNMSINRCAGCGQRLEARRRRASSPAAAPAPPAQAGDMLAGAGRNTEVSPSMLLLGHLSSGALQLETESWRAGNPPCRRQALATRSGDHQAAGHGSLHAARGPQAEYEPRIQSHISPSRRPNMVPAAALRCTGRRRRTGRRHTDAGGTHSKGRCGRAFHDTTIVYAIQSEAELQLHGPQRASPCSPGQRSPPGLAVRC